MSGAVFTLSLPFSTGKPAGTRPRPWRNPDQAAVDQFIQGFKYPFTSFGLLLKPGIRLYVIIPLIINILVFTLAIIYIASNLNEFINTLKNLYELLYWLPRPVSFIVDFMLVLLCCSILVHISAPFNNHLAWAVEQTLSDEPTATQKKPGLLRPGFLGLRSEAQRWLYYIIWSLPLLLLFLIPIVRLATPLIWLLFIAWTQALQFSEYPMGNHGLLFSEQRKKLISNRPLVLGFGVGVLFLVLTPVLNFIVIPAAVIGATRMYMTHFKAEIPAVEGASGGHS